MSKELADRLDNMTLFNDSDRPIIDEAIAALREQLAETTKQRDIAIELRCALIAEFAERAEAAEEEVQEQCRLNAMGSEREAKLMAEIDMERKRRWEGNEISSNEHIAEVVQLKEEIRRARDEGLEDAVKWVQMNSGLPMADRIFVINGIRAGKETK